MDEILIEFLQLRQYFKDIEPRLIQHVKDSKYIEKFIAADLDCKAGMKKLYEQMEEFQQGYTNKLNPLSEYTRKAKEPIEPIVFRGIELTAQLICELINGRERIILSYSASPVFRNLCVMDGSFSRLIYNFLIADNIQERFPHIVLPKFADQIGL